MRTLRGWITTTVLVATLTLAAAPARAGIIVGNLSTETPCGEATKKVYWDLITRSLSAIIVGNLTGIIVGNISDSPTESCAIIVGN